MAGECHRNTLGDYFTLQRGTTYKSRLLGLTGPVLLGLASIQRNGGFRSDSLQTYGGDSPDKLLVQPGDLYLSLKDVTQSADLLGAVARLPADHRPGRLTQDTVKLEPKGTHVPLDYLYWLLRTPQYRSYCRAHATGTTNLGLAREDFLAFPAPEPTPTQRKIVEALGTLDDKIELNRRVNETLEEMVQALFKSWFVDFSPVRAKAGGRTPGLPKPLADLFPDRFEDSELGEIPAEWAVLSVYDVATYINGAAYAAFQPNDERRGLPIIKIAELKAGVRPQTKFSDVEMAEKYRIKRGDILFSWSGNPDTSIDTFVWPHDSAWLNQHIFRVVPHPQSERTFVLSILKHLKPVFAEIARNKQTTGLGHVTVADMKLLSVTRPDDRAMRAWDAIASPLLDRAFQNELEIHSLATLRDTLLPELISGELRVAPRGTHCAVSA